MKQLVILIILLLLSFQIQKSEKLKESKIEYSKKTGFIKKAELKLNKDGYLKIKNNHKEKRYNNYYFKNTEKTVYKSQDCRRWIEQNQLISSNVGNDSQKSQIIISPIPAEDYITINCGSIGTCSNENNIWANPNASIDIYDIMGILQYSAPVDLTPVLSEGEGVRIDISNLSAGIYFIRIGDRIEKFVKI